MCVKIFNILKKKMILSEYVFSSPKKKKKVNLYLFMNIKICNGAFDVSMNINYVFSTNI